MGCFKRVDWLSRRFLEVACVCNLVEICDVTNGVGMFSLKFVMYIYILPAKQEILV